MCELLCTCSHKSYFPVIKNVLYKLRNCVACNEQAYQCGYCGLFFRRKDNFKRHCDQKHGKCHKLSYPFIDKLCKICSQMCPISILDEERNHGNIKEHLCNTKSCGTIFYQCTLCKDFVSIHKWHFLHHMQNKHAITNKYTDIVSNCKYANTNGRHDYTACNDTPEND